MLKWQFSLIVILAWGLVACSSDSYFAGQSIDSLGGFSPIGSREVKRHHRLSLSSRYRVYVAYADQGLHNKDKVDLNRLATNQLGLHLKQAFPWVIQETSATDVKTALMQARRQESQVLMYPVITSWPNIEPIRLKECESKDGTVTTRLSECESDEKSGKDDKQESDTLTLTVAIYDVLSGQQLDMMVAKSNRGMASYVYKDTLNELDALMELVVRKLAPNAPLY